MLRKLLLITLLSPVHLALADSNNIDKQVARTNESEGIIGNLLHKNDNKIVIYPYETNYILHTYTDRFNDEAIHSYDWAENARKDETKYQLSFISPIAYNLLGENSILGISYTQRSLWQSTNASQSSPFRETNYEPQLFLGWGTNYPVLGWLIKDIELGLNYQTNGKSDETARSWHRIYARLLAVKDNFLVEFKPWIRFSKQQAESDKRDITKYLGYYRLKLGYRYNDQIFSLTGHYNWDTGYGNAELGWSIPVSKSLRFYTQLFSGYGESLIDYNFRQTRVGIGFMLNDLPIFTSANRRDQTPGYQYNPETSAGIIGNLIADQKNKISIYPYEANYILYSYTSNLNKSSIQAYNWANNARKDEVKFQISIGLPIWVDIFGKDSLLGASYTQRSFWQASNTDASSPFRETNYEPQIFLGKKLDYTLFGWTIEDIEFGFNHQSNGQAEATSHSWNRIYGRVMAKRGNFMIDFKPWYRIPERKSQDDNPDITKYMGHYRLKLGYHYNGNIFSAIGHYNIKSGYGGAEVGWSYPISKSLRLYTQVFSGYGESMIDYNKKQTRIGIGIMINDVF